MEMSAWPVNSVDPHPALRWKLQVDVGTANQAQNVNQRCLEIKVIVEEGAWMVDSSSQAPYFEVMPLKSKNDGVEAWYPKLEMIGTYDRVA
ncbi:unnamed protein product [Phytophthora fragariaefolia]|uniref:Unnamed protein product n=1 Tax=Phytophthora fragariaefolia TaxID=1490495 RepID=A0A9W7D4G8_9STRA|nr:unnamed protein product [Phytophthora fragariaefolia]